MSKLLSGIFGLLLGFVGATIVGHYSNYYVVFGIFLLLWANNLSIKSCENKEINSRDFWT
jgi:hypothetical protein